MVAGPRRARPLGRPHGRAHREGAAPRPSRRRRVEGHGAPPRGLRRHRRVERHRRPPSLRRLLEQGPRRRAHGHQRRLRRGRDGLDGLGRHDGHALGRARDGAAAARRPHYCTCAHVRVFEIPSLSSSRGVLSREWLWPRASTARSRSMGGSSFVNGALIAAGRWFITLGSISWRIPRLRSGLGLRAFHGREKRQRSRGRVVASGASRLPARVAGGGEDRLTHVVWQRQRPVADAGSYGASRADADSNRRLDELPSDLLPPHARSDGQTRRANRVASGFRKLETLQQHPLAPTALTIDRCGGGKTQAHSDGERAAREISAAGEPVERAANHARPGGGARCARAARLQWQQPLGHKKAGAAECLSKYREGRRARRAEI